MPSLKVAPRKRCEGDHTSDSDGDIVDDQVHDTGVDKRVAGDVVKSMSGDFSGEKLVDKGGDKGGDNGGDKGGDKAGDNVGDHLSFASCRVAGQSLFRSPCSSNGNLSVKVNITDSKEDFADCYTSKIAPTHRLRHPADSSLLLCLIGSTLLFVFTLSLALPASLVLMCVLPILAISRVLCSKMTDKSRTLTFKEYCHLTDARIKGLVPYQCLLVLSGNLRLDELRQRVASCLTNEKNQYYTKLTRRLVETQHPSLSKQWSVDHANDFRLDRHVTERSVASRDLREYVSGLTGQPLSPDKPLWEIHLINCSDRCYVLLRVHASLSVTDDAPCCHGNERKSSGVHENAGNSSSHTATSTSAENRNPHNDKPLVSMFLKCILDKDLSSDLQINGHIDDITDKKPKRSKRLKHGTIVNFIYVTKSYFVWPLRYFGMLIGTLCQDKNGFKRKSYTQLSNEERYGVIWSPAFCLNKITRIKQITRCTLQDVFISALSGSLRNYAKDHNLTSSPHDMQLLVGISGDCHDDDAMYTKDLRSSRFKNYDEMDDVQTMKMPTRTEGAIPRLWEVRQRMNKLTTGSWPVTYKHMKRIVSKLQSTSWYSYVRNRILNKAAINMQVMHFTNSPNCQEAIKYYICKKEVKSILSFSPMASGASMGISFSVQPTRSAKCEPGVSDGKIRMTLTYDRHVIRWPRDVITGFMEQMDVLMQLLSHRRVPGKMSNRNSKSQKNPNTATIIEIEDDLQVLSISDIEAKIVSVQEKIQFLAKEEQGEGSKIKLLKEWYNKLIRELRSRQGSNDNQNEDDIPYRQLRVIRKSIVSITSTRRNSHDSITLSEQMPDKNYQTMDNLFNKQQAISMERKNC